MIGEAEYVAALSPESPFFVSPPDKENFNADSEKKWDAESSIPATWTITRRKPWTYVGPARERMLVAGWKIHLSATIENANVVLATAIKVCCSHGVSFKFLSSYHQFLQSNSEQAPRSASGKFVTIYPDSNQQVDTLTSELYQILQGQEGPYILSDVRYLNSPIFFRYGGFINIQFSDEKGADLSAIPGTDGLLREDQRLPRFIEPLENVATPSYVKTAIAQYMKDEATPLDDYELTPLHFSNSGGVYHAKNKQGRESLLKEARPYAGLDGGKRDAVKKLATEWKVLNTLSDTGFTPVPYRQFGAWEHKYIEMEYLEGVTLNHWLAVNYPYQWQNGYPRQLDQYIQSLISYGRQIITMIEKIHTTGCVHGDIHLGNIMVNDDDETVRLIDFEDERTPESTEPSPHNALGFRAPDGYNAEEADWFAVSRTLAVLCYPSTSISMLCPEHWAATLNRITNAFGHEFSEILRASEEHCPNKSSMSSVPFTPIQHPSVASTHYSSMTSNGSEQRSTFKKDVIKGIEATKHAVIGRLFPCDAPKGNLLMATNINTGAAGVLLSLHRSGEPVLSADLQWIKDHTVSRLMDRKVDLGLYTGLAGISMLADEIGDVAYARRLLCIVKDRWHESKSMNLADGLAGEILALLSHATFASDNQYLEEAIAASQVLEERLMKGKYPAAVQTMKRTGGLYHGWSGVALLWLALSHIVVEHSDRYAQYAVDCIEKDLSATILDKTGIRGTLDSFNRSLPYFADGTAGILVAVCAARTVLQDDSLFEKEWDSLQLACSSSMYAFSGLNRGIAGIIIANQFASVWAQDAISTRNRLITSLDDYALQWNNTLQFPGDSYLRLSSDYATGSAGILTAFNTIDHDSWDFLPLMNSKDLFYGNTIERK